MSENDKRHGTLPRSTYVVHGYYVLDGVEFMGLYAFSSIYTVATALARSAVHHGFERSEVICTMYDGLRMNECCYRISAHEYCRDYTLEALRQLHEAATMPDPEDSEFFSTPCEPMAMI